MATEMKKQDRGVEENRRPHVYVMFCADRIEAEALDYLTEAEIQTEDHYAFLPKGLFYLKKQGVVSDREKLLYPGMIFFNLSDEGQYYQQLDQSGFLRRFGHQLRMEREEQGTYFFADSYKKLLHRLNDAEENAILRTASACRNADGRIVNLFHPDESASFVTAKSVGVKHKYVNTQTGEEAARITITSGVLQGMENLLISVKSHKRIGVIRLILLQKPITVTMPLESIPEGEQTEA